VVTISEGIDPLEDGPRFRRLENGDGRSKEISALIYGQRALSMRPSGLG